MEIVSEILNNNLIKQQGLDEKTVRLIEEKHQELNQILKMIHNLEWNDENKGQILQLSQSLELIEFQMQKLWGFEQSLIHHTHWLRNSKCNCPISDNREAWGHHRIHRGDCLIHGENARPEFWQNLKYREENK